MSKTAKNETRKNNSRGCKEKILTIKIRYELLERIAEFYKFPTVVFFSDLKHFPKGETRNERWRKKAEKFDKIREIMEEE